MKKPILFICAMLIMGADTLLAQGFYIQPSVGYSIPLIAQPAGKEYTLRSNASNYTADYKTNYSNLGSGINGGISLGFIANEFMAFEISGHYIHTPVTVTNKNQSYLNGTLRIESEMKTGSTMINIAPGLRFFKSFAGDQLFVRVAPVFGITRVTLQMTEKDYISVPNEIEDETFELSGNLAYGMFASAGFTKMFTERMGISVELFSNLQHYVPAKGLLTKSVLNGVDQMPNKKKSQKEIEFVDKVTYTDIPKDNEPSKFVNDKGLSFLMSGVGLQVGLFIKL